MPLKTKINNLHKNHLKSVNENLQWFNETLDNKKSNEVLKHPANQFLKPGKIYRFNYKPSTFNKLPYYDMNPLVISLGTVKFKTNKVDLCLNLNYFPYDVKLYIINTLYKVYKNIIDTQTRANPFNAKSQKFYLLTYDILTDLLSSVNIQFGIRNYLKVNRYKTRSISYENLYRLPFIEEYKFMKKGVKMVHNYYYKSIKK